LATSVRVSVPSVVIVVAPLPVVTVKLPAGRAVVLLAKTPEAHEDVVARLLTTTT
jgi:hypothetical protein